MNRIFADAGYWIALASPHDQFHKRAHELSASLRGSQIVTSEWVLTELLNGLADRNPGLRAAAVKIVLSLHRRTDVIIVPLSTRDFLAAFMLYRERADKGWSLTDCSSFLVMQQLGIETALTPDRHFEQAGFTALLR